MFLSHSPFSGLEIQIIGRELVASGNHKPDGFQWGGSVGQTLCLGVGEMKKGEVVVWERGRSQEVRVWMKWERDESTGPAARASTAPKPEKGEI